MIPGMQHHRGVISGLAASGLAVPHARPIAVCGKVPAGAHEPLDHFLSYSIEFSSFTDFAGNLSNPNTYSDNLLGNIAYYAGSMPLVRVGGNTQDPSLFDESQELAVIQTFDPANPDYPANQTFGPAFFESYQTWPDVRFSHGFNMGEDDAEAREALLASVPCSCNALQDKVYELEFGNEADLMVTSYHWQGRSSTNEMK